MRIYYIYIYIPFFFAYIHNIYELHIFSQQFNFARRRACRPRCFPQPNHKRDEYKRSDGAEVRPQPAIQLEEVTSGQDWTRDKGKQHETTEKLLKFDGNLFYAFLVRETGGICRVPSS